MKKVIYLLAFLLLANAISLQAQINGKRWFAEVTVGGGRSRGSFEMNEFYDPAFSFSADFGYMLTPNIGILPVSVSYYGFRFDKKKYIDNYWNYKDEYDRRRWEEWEEELGGGYWSRTISSYSDIAEIEIIDFDAESNLWGLSFTQGLIFFSPTYAGLRGFVQVGAGIYYSRVWINNIPTYEGFNSAGNWYRSTISIHLKEMKKDFGMIFRGGVEYDLIENMTLTLKIRYNHVLTGEKNKITKIINLNGLWFYYLTENGLQFNRFLEEKNTRIVEFKGGFKLYF